MSALPPASARRRPGVIESVISWVAWAVVGLIALVLAFAAIFPVGFGGAYPEKADEIGALVWCVVLTMATVVVAPIGMAIGHWRRWHIWYWPALCGAAAATTFAFLQAL